MCWTRTWSALGRVASGPLMASLVLWCGCAPANNLAIDEVSIPTPGGLRAGKYFRPGKGRRLAVRKVVLTPTAVIRLTFEHNPQIKQTYMRYAAERARYDYYIASWTSLTPGFSVSAGTEETTSPDDEITRDKSQTFKVFVDKNFFNTSKLRLSAEYENEASDGTHAGHPYLAGSLRYPLWASREALARTSEQIFQQNRVNDAQLAYVKAVRNFLRWALSSYYSTVEQLRRVELVQQWLDDIKAVRQRLMKSNLPTRQADLRRVDAEIASLETRLRSFKARYKISVEALKSVIGLPFETKLEFKEEPFNPFADISREDLFRLSVQTDPEIATLKNAIKNAEVQLELARKGRLDIALLLSGSVDMRGSGGWTGKQVWRADAGLEVRFVDPRVSSSLEREALATVAKFQQAMQARKNDIYVGTIDPLLTMNALMENKKTIEENIKRYKKDWETGLKEYFAGRMNIDDLLRRRENLFGEQRSLVSTKASLGRQVAALCSTTGKFFEFLKDHIRKEQPQIAVDASATQPSLSTQKAEDQEPAETVPK